MTGEQYDKTAEITEEMSEMTECSVFSALFLVGAERRQL